MNTDRQHHPLSGIPPRRFAGNLSRLFRIFLALLLLAFSVVCMTGCGAGSSGSGTENSGGAASSAADRMDFVDVMGYHHQMTIDRAAGMNDYLPGRFLHGDDGTLTYADSENYTTRLGIDVSRYQGTVDWEKVKAQGYDFCFLRIGYRGYGAAGTLNEDPKFEENYAAASAAGFNVGVYFFAQAVNEEEAKEEADYVLQLLGKRKLQLPIIYDPESITGDNARTDGVSGEQFTLNTLAFCKEIRKNGYEAGVYANMLWEAYQLDLPKLEGIPIWYADYEPQPQTPYRFTWWQYTDEGHVDGVSGPVDLNIWMIPTGS